MNSKYVQKTFFIAQAGVIAAIYTVLTMIAAGFDLASGAIQVRFSEALTILPFFTPAAVPGLTLGCLISNLVTGCALPDIIFGSLATFIGAFGSYHLRRNRFLVSLPPIVSNMLIIPFISPHQRQDLSRVSGRVNRRDRSPGLSVRPSVRSHSNMLSSNCLVYRE